jgi:hypothetical protein
LRRRRRHSTQIFRSDTNSPLYPQAVKPKKKWLRYTLFFFLLVLICLGTYYVYETYYFPQAIPSSKSAVETNISPLPAAPAQQQTNTSETPAVMPKKKTQVEILNGCGKEGVAKIFQTYLQEQGFDVVNTDNYIENGKRRWDVPESMIIDQTGKSGSAKDLARVLGISNQKIIARPTPNAIYDLSVIIGRDYVLLKATTQKNR